MTEIILNQQVMDPCFVHVFPESGLMDTWSQ